eukprot:4497828-Alexandrium_andersonii.AAC.1
MGQPKEASLGVASAGNREGMGLPHEASLGMAPASSEVPLVPAESKNQHMKMRFFVFPPSRAG